MAWHQEGHLAGKILASAILRTRLLNRFLVLGINPLNAIPFLTGYAVCKG